MPRPARLALSLVVAALTALAFASVAPAQDSTDDPDATMEAQSDDGSAPADDGSGEDTTATDDGSFDVLDDSTSSQRGNDTPAAQDDAAANDGSGGGEAAQIDNVDRDCEDFDTQDEAQTYFESQNGDATHNVDNLDPDGDGKACESLNAPSGGVDAGGGGTAPRPTVSSSDPLPFALGGAALGLALAGLSLVMRRRRATA